MNPESFKEALEQKPMLGFCSMTASPSIIERIGPDWDWCWIDAQHGEWGVHNAVQAVRACNQAGIFSLVRVPGQEPGMIGKVLDTACDAVMAPMVDSREQAEAVVEAARFAPLGRRSYGGRRPVDLYGRAYSHAGRPQPLVVCQIESPTALTNLDDIAATEGVEALFFGPDDVAMARGMPMDVPRPEGCFDAELEAVAEAAARHGKIAAGVFRSEDAFKQAINLGYRLVVCTGDIPMLADGSRSMAFERRRELG